MNKGSTMRTVAGLNITLSVVVLLSLPSPVLAIPAITCHCFTERSFNAEHPAAADPYFLATTQNSFFAVMFNVDKRTIVIKKQSGTSSDDLWVAYWLARQAKVSPDSLLQARTGKDTWKHVVEELKISTITFSPTILKQLNNQSTATGLAGAILDDLCVRNQLLSGKELTDVRMAGATNQEVIIAAVISLKSGQPAPTVFKEVKNGSKTWGYLLKTAMIDTKNMQVEISNLVKRPVR